MRIEVIANKMKFHDINETHMVRMDEDISIRRSTKKPRIHSCSVVGDSPRYVCDYLMGRFIRTDETTVSAEFFVFKFYLNELEEEVLMDKRLTTIESILLKRKTPDEIIDFLKDLQNYDIL